MDYSPCGHKESDTIEQLHFKEERKRRKGSFKNQHNKRDKNTEGLVRVKRRLRRNITLSTKVHLVKAMVFPVVMYGCESWTVKKAEHQRTDAFELWFWRRLLTVPWTASRSNQSIPKEINPENSLEGLMLKLKLQYFGHLM